ncbi:hypothetical protein H6784_06015 [Candidatus Nomurabacteria bacterium]|nr:hypothetical protein [Candidatus Kaiserbacteria bacterium]MCB9811067.1 hypothetical protein [Candidatus Nomurabacteria bacterium]MCB9814927.1 hypothetical protein [Candidatus Nomurabacteria bacterium]
MNKAIVILFGSIFILILVFTFSGSSKIITNYPSLNTTVVAFGDSLVEGVGSTAGNDFVSELSRQINTPIVNLGNRGDSTRDALTRLDVVLKKKPKVVLLLLGGNDYLQKIPPEETFSNLGKIIESIHETGSIVILLGVRGGLLKDNFENNFESLADKYGTAYVPDVLDGLFGHADLMSDSVHPNDKGYKIIADKIYPVLKGVVD